MRYSLDWLRSFTPVPTLPSRELRDAVTTRIAEVESLEGGEARFAGPVVVGKILEIRKHPQADRLQCVVATTDGDDRRSIVCGATNIAVGQVVPVALPGATVLDRKSGESFTIKEAKLRGEPSQGMLCSADELGLPPKEDGIHQLPTDTPLGTPVAELLSTDTVLEIENKSLTHRPDLWGHWGIAREFAVLFGTPLTLPSPPPLPEGAGIPVRVDAATEARAYLAVTIDGVAATESPAWLRQRLDALGVTSVNAIVDATNLVMLETAQPLHAFDARHVPSVRVRRAKKGERLTTFDGSELPLDTEDVVIAGPDGALALAGVVGSPGTGVAADTMSIVLEAASFDPVRIRRTAARHGARTDAAVRFEKDLDPALAPLAAARAVELLIELFPDARVTGVTQVIRQRRKRTTLRVRLDELSAIIGVPVTRADARRIMGGLGCDVSGRGATLTLGIPSWRARDLASAEDVAEELARFLGFDTLPESSPAMPLTALAPADALRMRLRRELPQRCAQQLGASELVTYPFRDPEELRFWMLAPETHWHVLNPQSGAASHLRTSLLPGLFSAAAENLPRLPELQRDGFRLMELGQVFHRDAGHLTADLEGTIPLPHQPLRLGLAELASSDAFRRLQGAVADLLSGMGLEGSFHPPTDVPAPLHPGRTAELRIGSVVLGIVGELHPVLRARAEGCSLAFAELDVDALVTVMLATPHTVSAPPAFPASARDVSAVFPEERSVADVLAAVRAASPPNLESLRVLDVFRGGALPEGSKSVTVRMLLQAGDRTMVDADIAAAVRVVEEALRGIGGDIR